MLIQLSPPMPLETKKGPGLAHFIIDYGIEHNLHWVVFIDATGECWTFQNPDIRAQKNITQGREQISPIHEKKSSRTIAEDFDEVMTSILTGLKYTRCKACDSVCWQENGYECPTCFIRKNEEAAEMMNRNRPEERITLRKGYNIYCGESPFIKEVISDMNNNTMQD